MPGTCSIRPAGVTRLAITSVLVLRSVSAWALPRASAIASAKLANSTVNQSQSEICTPKPTLPAPVAMSRIDEHRRQRGADLDDEHHRVLQQRDRVQLRRTSRRSPRATISGSNSGRDRASFFGSSDVGSLSSSELGGVGVGVVIAMISSLKAWPGRTACPSCIRKCSTIGAERQRREERQRADDDDRADQQPDEQAAVRRECAAA